MKYIKYIAAALLLVAGIYSCNPAEEGTIGQTTVQFANAIVEGGFGGGYVDVPLIIESDTEEGMNSCNVSAKVKIITTGEPFEGTHDEDGLSGDYRVTSFDVNFPPYGNYFDKKEPKKYYSEERGKWVKEVHMEVMILSKDLEELRFSFEIESATTTIGAQKQCTVVLQKTIRDRMCGDYTFTTDQGSWDATVTWDNTYSCFNIAPINGWSYTPLYTYWDEKTESMFAYPCEAIMWYSSASMQMCYTAFYSDWSNGVLHNQLVPVEFDAVAGTLTFPAELAFAVVVYGCDEAYNPDTTQYVGRFIDPFTSMVLVKK